jgi:hypothetical protein
MVYNITTQLEAGMKAKEIVARARWYERYDDASPAECLLSVLIDIFTDEAEEESLDASTMQLAWQRLTRDLSVAQCLEQHQAFSDGVDLLAGNLAEAGRRDLATSLHSIAQPRLEGAAHSDAVDVDRLRRLEDGPEPQGDDRLWVPRSATRAGHGV